MTRRSKRELERAVDAFGDTDDPSDAPLQVVIGGSEDGTSAPDYVVETSLDDVGDWHSEVIVPFNGDTGGDT